MHPYHTSLKNANIGMQDGLIHLACRLFVRWYLYLVH